LEKIKLWYKEEEEAYYHLSKDNTSNNLTKHYLYEKLNNFYGLKYYLGKLKNKRKVNILCFGAGWGGEVFSIIEILNFYNIKDYNITIIDSSTEMLNNIKLKDNIYTLKANIDGSIDVSNEKFDFITCFGVLHHIPNVSYVFSELNRVLKRKGFLLIRELISSMGNWKKIRKGATINERGLPIRIY